MNDFEFKFTDSDDDTEITLKFSGWGLNTVLEKFEQFLRGAGYSFEGNLEFVSDEYEDADENEDDESDSIFNTEDDDFDNQDDDDSWDVFVKPAQMAAADKPWLFTA